MKINSYHITIISEVFIDCHVVLEHGDVYHMLQSFLSHLWLVVNHSYLSRKASMSCFCLPKASNLGLLCLKISCTKTISHSPVSARICASSHILLANESICPEVHVLPVLFHVGLPFQRHWLSFHCLMLLGSITMHICIRLDTVHKLT